MRVRADNHANVAAGGQPQTLQVVGIGRAGIDDHVTRGRFAHQVAVGARAGHHAGVGCGQALQVLQQWHGPRCLPVQRVNNLPVGAGQVQLAIGAFVLHEPGLAALQQAGARAGGPQRLFVARAVGQYRIDAGIVAKALQGANRRKQHEELVCGMPRQGLRRAEPDRLELLGFVGHRLLAGGHARHQKGHVKAFGQVAVCHPVRQHIHLVSCQAQSLCLALRGERQVAV